MANKLEVIDKRMSANPETTMDLQDNSPASMMMAAISKGMELDKLEKFMELQERFEQNEARKAYHEAMAAFKENPPEIEKDKHVFYSTQKGNVDYRHASLANVCNKINSSLAKHGLSSKWEPVQAENGITVTCTITHKMGHSESTSLSAAPDLTGSKNSIQAVGSTISYLERYTLLALTGLATTDMDNDGGKAEVKLISEEQAKIIKKIISDKNVNEKQFLEYMKSESIKNIIAKDYQKAVQALKVAKGEKKKEEKKEKKTVLCPDLDYQPVEIDECEKCKGREGCPAHEEGKS